MQANVRVVLVSAIFLVVGIGCGAGSSPAVVGGAVGGDNGGGSAGACSTQGATGSITLRSEASRLQGVAPLAVFFDAAGTTATATTRPFHDLEYRWNFGDPEGSPISGKFWSSGSRPGVSSRNLATGAVASHVYEKPGTYLVTIEVTDGANSVSGSCHQIIVQNPEDVFSGSNTICFSKSGDFSSPPTSGCGVQVTDPAGNFTNAIANHAGAGKRLLFRRGEIWTAASTAVLSKTGPGVIGSYGSSQNPPAIQSTGGQNILHISTGLTPSIGDWRFIDLDFDGLGGNINGVVGTGGFRQLTLLRLAFRNMQNGIQFGSDTLNSHNSVPATAGHSIWDQFALVDSDVGMPAQVVSYGAFLSGDRVAVQGNRMELLGVGAHVLRATYLGKSIISNNTLTKSSVSVNHALKLHGPSWRTLPATDTIKPNNVEGRGLGDGYTRWVMISDNKFEDDATDMSVVLGPQNNSKDERVADVVFERNWLTSGGGNQYGLVLSTTDSTVRNNVFDMSGGTKSANIAILVFREGIEPAPSGNHIYNNTAYLAGNNGGSDGFSLVNLRATAVNSIIKNNLAFAPNAVTAAPRLIDDDGAIGTVSEGNSSDLQVKSGPNPFEVGTPSSLANFNLAPGSYAVNAGTSAPVFSDISIAPFVARPNGLYDMGAKEF